MYLGKMVTAGRHTTLWLIPRPVPGRVLPHAADDGLHTTIAPVLPTGRAKWLLRYRSNRHTIGRMASESGRCLHPCRLIAHFVSHKLPFHPLRELSLRCGRHGGARLEHPTNPRRSSHNRNVRLLPLDTAYPPLKRDWPCESRQCQAQGRYGGFGSNVRSTAGLPRRLA